jgi:CTP synthase
MQVATVEFARNVIGLKDANSTEFNAKTNNKIFLKLKELTNIEEMGHNMRLGSYSCSLKKDSLAFAVYKQLQIHERHRHRYEFNPAYEKLIEDHGMKVAGKNLERNLVEMVEIPGHPWYSGCQFHPEFRSKPLQPHPLFVAFIKAAKDFQIGKQSIN